MSECQQRPKYYSLTSLHPSNVFPCKKKCLNLFKCELKLQIQSPPEILFCVVILIYDLETQMSVCLYLQLNIQNVSVNRNSYIHVFLVRMSYHVSRQESWLFTERGENERLLVALIQNTQGLT